MYLPSIASTNVTTRRRVYYSLPCVPLHPLFPHSSPYHRIFCPGFTQFSFWSLHPIPVDSHNAILAFSPPFWVMRVASDIFPAAIEVRTILHNSNTSPFDQIDRKGLLIPRYSTMRVYNPVYHHGPWFILFLIQVFWDVIPQKVCIFFFFEEFDFNRPLAPPSPPIVISP